MYNKVSATQYACLPGIVAGGVMAFEGTDLRKGYSDMPDDRDLRFFPTFIGTTMGVLLEIITKLVDEIIVSNLFDDGAFASVNLIEPYIILGCKRLSDKEEYGAQASFPTTCSRRSRTAIHCRSCLSASSLAS